MICPTQKFLPDNTQLSQKALMSPTGFEPAIPASEQPQTHALARAATGIGWSLVRFFEPMKPVDSLFKQREHATKESLK
jgi:hypothetical protein